MSRERYSLYWPACTALLSAKKAVRQRNWVVKPQEAWDRDICSTACPYHQHFFASLMRWGTGHCHWIRRLTCESKLGYPPKGQLQWKTQRWSILGAKQKYENLFSNLTKELPYSIRFMREMWWLLFSTSFSKSMILIMFALARQARIVVYEKQYHCYFPFCKQNRRQIFRNDIAKVLQQWNCCLNSSMSFSCLRTSIWRRNGHWQYTLASAWTIRNFDRNSLLFLQAHLHEII